mmetsp:Transcript_13211/g.33718  ORF Transcript_13211/g.33718 Transcript_13211/m.33718 type:complete len:99 (-) Transcript_13211:1088-1384(-)
MVVCTFFAEYNEKFVNTLKVSADAPLFDVPLPLSPMKVKTKAGPPHRRPRQRKQHSVEVCKPGHQCHAHSPPARCRSAACILPTPLLATGCIKTCLQD